VFVRQARDLVDDGKDRVGHWDSLEGIVRKADFDFLPERTVPFLIGAPGTDEKETASSEELADLAALLVTEAKALVAGHDAEWEVKDPFAIEAHGAEFSVHAQAGLLSDIRQKAVGKADGTAVPAID
jgi:hypothetical protein